MLKIIKDFKWPLLFVAVIIGFSLQSGETSGEVSGGLAEFIHFLFGGMSSKDYSALEIDGVLRKIAHYTEYSILGTLLFMSFYEYMNHWFFKAVASVVFVFIVAFVDEALVQVLISNARTGNVYDILIDTVGGGLGCVLMIIAELYHKRYMGI